MPYIQNTDEDRRRMLAAVGAGSIDELFADIPEAIRWKGTLDIPDALPEMELQKRIHSLALKNVTAACRPTFLGAGSYRHFIPAVVDELAGRSEFVTAYTPYQPEASQGALQAFFEYQTLICMLTGLDISNASMYDGATALAEAALMASDLTRKDRIVVSAGVHPHSRSVLTTYLQHMGIEIVEIPLEKGTTSAAAVKAALADDAAGLLFQSPNFFGCIEDVEALAAAAAEAGALSAVSVDPVSLAILEAPGLQGADIVVGEGQALGSPMNFGGPGFGFMATREKYVRRLPGRIVGQTVDDAGRKAYVLTFQAREQHIRRGRATSNICTNHALIALRGAIYLAALGRTGFRKLGGLIAARARRVAERVTEIPGFKAAFEAPFFKEFTIKCPRPASEINRILYDSGIVGGYEAGKNYDGMDDHMILAVTELTGEDEVERLIETLKGIG
jgi:glycine dehydrogenase subunit 1